MNGKKKTKRLTTSHGSEAIETIRKKSIFITPSDHELRRLHGVTKQLQIRVFKLNDFKKPKSSQRNLHKLHQEGVEVELDILKGKKSTTIAKPWLCSEPNCAFKAQFKCNLTEHMRIHTGARPYKCQLCPCKFRQHAHLKRHVTLHHFNNSKQAALKYICDVCQFPSSSRGNLKIHMRKHSGNRPFKCPFCKHATKHSCSLNAHIRTHTKERPYKCNLCSYTCAQSAHLIRHIRTHTKETPIRCELSGCDYSTTTKRQLKMHLIQKHGCGVRDRKYKCELCPESRAYYTRENLNHHAFRHTGLKPHQCQWCPKKYSRKWVKVEHEKTCAVRPS